MIEKKISVIIPVYKTEPYLNQCIDSIVNQSYKNLEIILVDDGSPDNSPKICDEWAIRDKRIKVIHTVNGGAGNARNTALKIATGEFVSFVDSDDYIASRFYEILISLFNHNNDLDIVECNYVETSDNIIKEFNFDNDYILSYKEYSKIEGIEENIKDENFRQIIWNKLYRKRVIKDICFPVGTKIDDEFWTYKVLANVKKLAKISNIMYAYRQQNDSIMHSINTKNRIETIMARYERHLMICKYFSTLISLSSYNLMFSCVYVGQIALRNSKKDEQQIIFEYLCSILEKLDLWNIFNLNIPITHYFWIILMKINLKNTCKLRNILKIGL